MQKFTISNDKNIYEAWPDVVLTNSGKLICVFSECTHHLNRDYTRIMLTESGDRGRTWTSKHPLTEGTKGLNYYYNCARISKLSGGRLVITVDRVSTPGEEVSGNSVILLYFSADDGKSWSDPVETPVNGIVPDKLTELENGRWILAAHYKWNDKLTQFMRYSDDGGKNWSPRITVAEDPRYNLCEASMLPLGNNTIVAFMRENSSLGWDCQKTISYDNGETWGEVIAFPLPGCHRPVSGFLQDDSILITYRFMAGISPQRGSFRNLFASFTNRESALADKRTGAGCRILPLDHDRAAKADCGYSGWVQFPDGEIYVVYYIVDDAVDKGQIRGCSLNINEFMLP